MGGGLLNGVDLFSGIGGLSLALSPWVRTFAYCENDSYCQGVLLSRMQTGHLRVGPIWDDVRTLEGCHFPDEQVDIIYGGFPCQDISVAGRNGKGLDGKRSGLFYEIRRLAEEIRPKFIFLENVPAIRTRGAVRVCEELASLRYDLRWGLISAFDMGAPHKRDRWFLLANAQRESLWDIEQRRSGGRAEAIPSKGEAEPLDNGCKKSVAHADGVGGLEGLEGLEGLAESHVWKWRADIDRPDWWSTEPDVDRVAYGVPFRVDRIRGLGNSVVPSQARKAFKRLMGLE